MAMSDCEKCWETPCVCGYDYETWETPRIQALVDVLTKLVARRSAGEARRQSYSESRIVKTKAP